MAKAKLANIHADADPSNPPRINEEDRGLLDSGSFSDDEDDIVVYPDGQSEGRAERRLERITTEHHTTDQNTDAGGRTPRTPNRVRFDIPASSNNSPPPSYSPPLSGHRDRPTLQFTPLLTNIEAPSVTLANSPWEGDDDPESWAERERSRPKSGLRSAFMNMANSIIGAGIIGQPYAFKQAGLLAGVLLLIGLTICVDWTIRLIVINSKLSGRDSFQGTVEFCFGKKGLIAISVAQWAFAFGGMVAFGIIVGDTIPHVFLAVWPNLREVPVLGLLADRRTVIVVFILGISYPLSLYRDIAKVCSSHEGGGPERGTDRIGSWRKRVQWL
jgi:sodium-coupled neutral amino acid transporter 11